MAIEKYAFQLVMMNYEVDRFKYVPLFNQYKCVNDLNNKGDEGYYSNENESKTDEGSVKNNKVKIRKY